MPIDASSTLAIDGFLALVTAIIYARVTQLIWARPIHDPHAVTANRLFALWWAALGALTLLGGAQSILASFGVRHLAIHAALTLSTIALVVVALYGLLSYLLYIYSGNPRMFIGLAIAHAAILAFYVGLIIWMTPVAVTTSTWRVDITYLRTAPPLVTGLASALLFIPALAGASLYGTLAFRAKEPTVRFRIVVVSTAFIFWFGASGIATLTGWTNEEAWPIIARAIALVATGLVILAYRPPPAIRKRLHVEAVPRPHGRDARTGDSTSPHA